jgi:DNA-binding winged helix-turn-helix (wHTH) protein
VPQQNAIAQKKSCNPDACIKTVRQKGYPFAAAAAWCARNNNGC